MAEEKKTLKFQMMMTPAEAAVLDDWMFENRVRSRAEAIRRLWQMALLQGEKLDKVKDLIEWGQDWIDQSVKAYSGERGLEIDLTKELPADAGPPLMSLKTATEVISTAVALLDEVKKGIELPDLPELPEPGPLFDTDVAAILDRMVESRRTVHKRLWARKKRDQ